MIITAIWPLIVLSYTWIVMQALRFYDRRFSSSTYVTRKPSVQTYIDLFVGPEFDIHWRYSAILFQMSISLFYGAGIPILYIVTFVGMFIQYVLDRLLVCYFFREPPTYDDRITQIANQALKFIGTFSLLGVWFQLRNESIFGKSENSSSHLLSPSRGPLILLISILFWNFFKILR